MHFLVHIHMDYGIPNLALCGVLVTIAIVQLCCLRLPYKRRAASEAYSSAVDLNSNLVLPVEETSDVGEDMAYESMETAATPAPMNYCST
ncbi:unnamed protein product [Echinostoma caproni]|uniref:Secreted protein n=1 Tax=Echinostoma caproni TaxID=27848 RepID=A0A183AZM0_9TREM|nr:unnamed protein product [Echinostoma caproni]